MKENPELEVRELSTDSLVPYANNAKLHSALQIEQIANSIQEFGFNDPIAVWENEKGEPEIVEGHGRVLAAKKLGMDKLPVIYLNHLSDRARRAYTHVHNQTTLNSGFDLAILDEEMEKLNSLADFDELEQSIGEFDWESFGFDTEDGGSDHVDGPQGELSDDYSDSIGTVVYEPKETSWEVSDLYKTPREDSLEEFISKVENSELREMLELRKAWFVDFNYAKIADYYAYQATKEEQRAFEALGLVLLDMGGLIANGFADLVRDL